MHGEPLSQNGYQPSRDNSLPVVSLTVIKESLPPGTIAKGSNKSWDVTEGSSESEGEQFLSMTRAMTGRLLLITGWQVPGTASACMPSHREHSLREHSLASEAEARHASFVPGRPIGQSSLAAGGASSTLHDGYRTFIQQLQIGMFSCTRDLTIVLQRFSSIMSSSYSRFLFFIVRLRLSHTITEWASPPNQASK
jgi:hypothetical protein